MAVRVCVHVCVYGVYGLWVYMWNVTTQLYFLSIHLSVHSFIHSCVYTLYIWFLGSECGVYVCDVEGFLLNEDMRDKGNHIAIHYVA